jgi:hypothetical protein
MTPVFRYKTDPNNLDPKSLKEISAAEIMAMSMPEFLQFKSKLANVRHRKRYDVAVFEAVGIPAGTTKTIFRKGIGQEDSLATSDTRFAKTRAHTNMSRDGEFEQGSLVIIEDVSAVQAITSGVPATVVNGIVTNARATFPAFLDPALVLNVWLNQVELAYKEGETEIQKGLLSEFPQNSGVSGFLGASPGGIAQNAFMPVMAMANPRVLEGGEDFSVDIRTLASFDATVATGVGLQITQKVELSTIEVIQVKL